MPKTLKENQENPQIYSNNGRKSSSISSYEQSREERIKENLQRMQKLGIFDLSQKMKSAAHPNRTPKHTLSRSQCPSPKLPTGPLRCSSRLKNATPVCYSEVVLSKKDKSLEDKDVKLEEGSKPEVYTEEHEKLLGNTEQTWTLFVDGYGEDGQRIYDPVKGKTCHQCRQKTLGHRTRCSKCNMVQGQFCGDCLYMRYGEHILEAIENPNWMCPVCRGICNCSLCRQAKGWYPTGPLYKKIYRLGYKSVAHYLIQTRRAQTTLEKSPDTVNQASAKRSLSFPGTEAFSKDSPEVNENQQVTLKPQSEEGKDGDDFNIEKETNMQGNPHHETSTKRSLPFSNIEAGFQKIDSTKVDLKVQNHFELSQPQLEAGSQNMELLLVNQKSLDVKQPVSNIMSDEEKEMHVIEEKKGEQEEKLHDTDKENNDSEIALKGRRNSKMKRAAIEPDQEILSGKSRQRLRKDNDHDDMELFLVNEESSDVKQAANSILSHEEKEMPITDDKLGDITLDGARKLVGKPVVATESDQDSTAGISRRMEKAVDIQKNRASSTTTNPDCIARRLRSRNKTT